MGILKKALSAVGANHKFTNTAASMKTKFALAMTTSGTSLSVVFTGNIFVKFYSDVIQLDPVIIGSIYWIIGIWGAVNGLVIGYLMDRAKFHPKRGKYVRIMRSAAPFILLSLFVMIIMSPSFPQWLIAVLFLAAQMLFTTMVAIYNYAYNCFQLLAAPTKEDRIDVSVLIAWIANFISFFASLVPNFLLVGNADMERGKIVFFLMLVLGLNSLVYFIALRILKDKRELYLTGTVKDEKINFKNLWKDVRQMIGTKAYWSLFLYQITAFAPMTIGYTMFLFMMDHAIGATGMQSAIVDAGPMIIVLALLPVIGNRAKKLGGKTAIYIFMVPLIIGQALLFISPNWIAAFAAFLLIWLGQYGANTAFMPLGAALIDDNERRTDVRKTGLYSAITSFLIMPFHSSWTVIYMTLIKAFGYVQGAAEQTPEAQMGIRLASTVLPIIMCLIGMIPLAFSPFNREVEADLSEYSRIRRSGAIRQTDPAPGESITPAGE